MTKIPNRASPIRIPTGTVTFLFTDIEGSTQLWEHHADSMPDSLRQHDALMRDNIDRCGGHVFKTVGDAFCATFSRPEQGLAAALGSQMALTNASWGSTGPLRVRMALHTGSAEERDGDYFGPTVNRVARLLSTGHGGQTLLSGVTFEQLPQPVPGGANVRDLGEHRLKDLVRPEHIYQVALPDLESEFPSLRSMNQFAHNLPVQLNNLVGRQTELAALHELSRQQRLVTLTGPGGVGKTRLAIAAAAESLEDHPDGTWYVELAPITDESLVPTALAAVLGVREHAGRPLLEQLIEFLQDRRVLIVLDNCEHVIDASARLAQTLLESCEHVRLLTTTREGLNIPGERIWSVPQLGCPPSSEILDPARLEQFDAVRLFVDRARAARSDFTLTPANAAAVSRLCSQLDGIPLALELAAVRTRTLSVGQICDRLDDRFRLLTGGSRTAQARQRTLEAAVAWSYDLLTPHEKTLFNTVSVFRGGWTLAAAEAVADEDVVDGLSSLVEKSLVLSHGEGMEPRYGMLETLRAYGRQHVEPGVMGHHAQYFLQLAQQMDGELAGPTQADALRCLAMEADNLREAQDFLRQASDASQLATLTHSLIAFYELRGDWAEGVERLSNALELFPPSGEDRLRVQLQVGLGRLLWRRGEDAAARRWMDEALDQARALQFHEGMAEALISLGNLLHGLGETDSAIASIEESLSLSREHGEERTAARALHALGVISEDRDTSERLVSEALVIFRGLGDTLGIARALQILGMNSHLAGEGEIARPYLEESMVLFQGLGNSLGTARALHLLGELARERLEHDEAARNLTEALVLFQQLGNRADIEGVQLSLDALK